MEYQLDAICTEISENRIEGALAGQPDNIYERILQDKITSKPRAQRELARKVLIWTAYARRPLSIHDLIYAVSIEMDIKSLEDLKSSILTEEYILGACAYLINIDWNPEGRYVHFIHSSMQEFLTTHSSTTLGMGYEVGHREIAQACMTFLTLFPKQSDFPARYTSLHQYAFGEWPHHLLAANLSNLEIGDQIVTLTLSFTEKSPVLITEQPMRLEGSSKQKTYLKFSPQVLALIFDLPGTRPFHSKQLKGGPSKTVYDGGLNCIVLSDDKIAIHYATAELNSVSVAQRLYNHGYTLNYSYSDPHGGDSEVPDWLQVSSLYSVQSTTMARYLLDNGISTKPQGLRDAFADPLKYFARKGNLGVEVFRLLMDRGVDGSDGRYDNALYAAACEGGVEVLKLLLDAGANVDAQGGEFGNALQAAACMGKKEVIKLLLDQGANANAQGGRYGNALQAAVYSGEMEVVRLLLDNGANINAQGGEYGNALQAAVLIGKVEIIQLLLEKGADVNTVAVNILFSYLAFPTTDPL